MLGINLLSMEMRMHQLMTLALRVLFLEAWGAYSGRRAVVEVVVNVIKEVASALGGRCGMGLEDGIGMVLPKELANGWVYKTMRDVALQL
jgi:hypothetical protein